MTTIHPLQSDISAPKQFTYPFCYEPHPLCQQAAEEVKAYIQTNKEIRSDADNGKMFGVLVCRDAEGKLAFLAAYSGLLAGRNDWSWFVPPVYDAQKPNGYFKQEEARISAINHEITSREQQPEYLKAREAYETALRQQQLKIEQQQQLVKAAKQARDERRLHHNISPEEHAALIRESQFMKAELHRLKVRLAAALEDKTTAWQQLYEPVQQLKRQRKLMSDQLQQWLFSQYKLNNARGEEKNVMDIFQGTIPPAATGDCCAPKLLQYAYGHQLQPLCMAEFWWGASPKQEIRHHGAYYPACRGRCLPLLTWMLQGIDVEPNPQEQTKHQALEIVYEDDALWVVCKPAGMLSVPGRIRRESVYSVLQAMHPQSDEPLIVHRLDMETSGLMVVAKTRYAHSQLQRQFERHEVKKRYVAVLEGTTAITNNTAHGRIALPLRPDVMDRPRQVVDKEYGKEAITDYAFVDKDTYTSTQKGEPIPNGDSRDCLLLLYPHTGRTHQLRVHCAHPEGLGCPIKGDGLYGHKADRLYLHADKLTFRHPWTNEEMTFERKADFQP